MEEAAPAPVNLHERHPSRHAAKEVNDDTQHQIGATLLFQQRLQQCILAIALMNGFRQRLVRQARQLRQQLAVNAALRT